MTSRSDTSSTAPSSFPADSDKDLLAINGHHFELGDTIAPRGGGAV